jgi:hypothetical protein
VRIDDERVGLAEALEEMPSFRQHQGPGPVGAVDVDPGVVVMGDAGERAELVDDAGVGRSCGGGHDRQLAGAARVHQRPCERLAGEAA